MSGAVPVSTWWVRPRAWVEIFAVANLGFLAVDIYVAHSFNGFRHPAEWLPFYFSLAAALVLLAAMIAARGPEPIAEGSGRWLGMAVGAVSIAVGLAGLVFHLLDTFFIDQTLKNLVYTAPFVAPLSYTGVGFLLVLDRMVEERREWAQWVVALALGGFAGNFVLCLADHAQNGFVDAREWIGVVASALAVGFLTALLVSQPNRAFIRLCQLVLLLQIGVGLLGFYFHAEAIRVGPMDSLWENLIYGTPAFAPLLFPNLALLAFLGLWSLEREL